MVALGAGLTSVGLLACGASTERRRAGQRAGTPPSIAASRILEGASDLAPGTVVRRSDLTVPGRDAEWTARVFADADHGYTLVLVDGITYPARSVDGGKTWRIDGPGLHSTAAQGGLGVGEIGVASASSAFAWGGITPDAVIDVTTDAGRHWWRSILPGSVLSVGREDKMIVANVYGAIRQGKTTHAAILIYRLNSHHGWTYAGALADAFTVPPVP